jgi:hypothetical protein
VVWAMVGMPRLGNELDAAAVLLPAVWKQLLKLIIHTRMFTEALGTTDKRSMNR